LNFQQQQSIAAALRWTRFVLAVTKTAELQSIGRLMFSQRYIMQQKVAEPAVNDLNSILLQRLQHTPF